MRRGALLLGLLTAVCACGPAGHDAEERFAAEASEVAPSGERAVRRVVRGPEARPVRPPPGEAVLDASLALALHTLWDEALARLEAAVAAGAERVVLTDPEMESGARLVWFPPPRRPAGRDPDLRVDARLGLDGEVPCLSASILGSPWVARYGCDASSTRRIEGWGEAARPGWGRLLDEALAAVGGASERLAVHLQVAGPARARATWRDVQPLAAEAILTRAGVVSLCPAQGACVRRADCTQASLVWLTAHQAADGHWAAAAFGEVCDGNPMRLPAADGVGDAGYDVGTTGLALLAFLGAGYSNRGRHPFAKVVASGLRSLKRCQREDGAFVGPGAPWLPEQHAIAALALLEAYGITGSPIYRRAAQRGLDALPRTFGSASHDGLPALAFTAAALASAGLLNEDWRRRDREPPLVRDERFADEIHSQCRILSASKRPDEAAVGLFGRILLGGEPARGEALRPVAEAVLRQPPGAGRNADALYDLFGTLAVFPVGGPPWKTWNQRLKEAVVGTQRRDGASCCYRGSWDPTGRGADRFGRVGATALRMLCTEVYYRYDRVFGCR